MNDLQTLFKKAEEAFEKRFKGPNEQEAWHLAESVYFIALAGVTLEPSWGTPDEMAKMLRDRRLLSVGAD